MSSQPVPALNSKAAVAVKVNSSKASVKETMSPPPSSESDKELLGSLTTVQQQRTSARVIKKLKLEPLPERDKRDNQECETPSKLDDKDPLKFPTVKQRMPKALWSADEKSLFFEALNEYGKDFDAITAHICAKMKKKGMPDGNLKTKTQVSHFYYRTWHKLSKHVRFDENVKKVAQELYALINYGELRKKLVSVNEKTCARLCEMVLGGSMVVRARGRNVRVRTPMCRALRRLNQITERGVGWRVCASVCVVLRARDAAAWARVQGAAHNPRLHVAAPLTAPLRTFLASLRKRWSWKHYNNIESSQGRCDDGDDCQESRTSCDDHDCDDRLAIEPDRTLQDEKFHGRLSLHLGPRPSAEIHIPVVTPSEQLSSQKICFSSYLERVCEQRRDKDGSAKIRTPKRQRKDSANDKDKEDQKKFKLDDCETNKPMVIDETAIDGIELMANFKNNVEDEEKPSTEDEKELREEQIEDDNPTEPERDKYMLERDKYMSEREKDSFSEMEDEDKYKDDKTDSDNESDRDKDKFKNLKVKFRIRPKKRGGSIYTLVTDKETAIDSEEKFIDLKVNYTKPDDLKEDPSKEEDIDTALKQIRKGWSELDAGDLTIGDLYLMFGSRSKLELDYWWAEATPPLPQLHKSPPIDKDRHIEKGIERKERNDSLDDDKDRARESDNDMFSPKNVFGQDSNDGMSGDERKCEQLASPEHKSAGGSLKLTSKLINRPTPNLPSDNGFNVMTDRLKRLLALAGNPHVTASQTTSSNVCNCGHICPEQRDRQKELYPPELSKIDDTSLVFRHPIPIAHKNSDSEDQNPELDLEVISKWRVRGKEIYSPTSSVFRQPTPIAPKPDHAAQKSELNLEGIPKWRRGRPRGSQRRVVVQRLLPLLPKLTTTHPNNSVPLKIVSGSQPALPKILPKPPPTSTSDLSYFYVLSESNGQFFFHDGDRRVPITPLPDNQDPQQSTDDESKDEDYRDDVKEDFDVKTDITIVEHEVGSVAGITETKQTQPQHASEQKDDKQDIANFLPTESMSLSPSRLLRTSEGWLDSNVQDFSLSSFLGHLDTRVQPDLNVDSQLQSLMVESSVDYVAKFADLAAEVTDEAPTLNTDHLT